MYLMDDNKWRRTFKKCRLFIGIFSVNFLPGGMFQGAQIFMALYSTTVVF